MTNTKQFARDFYARTTIKRLRNSLGVTQSELAEAAGVSRTTVVMIENGKQGISLTQLYNFADALDVHPAAILLGKGTV